MLKALVSNSIGHVVMQGHKWSVQLESHFISRSSGTNNFSKFVKQLNVHGCVKHRYT